MVNGRRLFPIPASVASINCLVQRYCRTATMTTSEAMPDKTVTQKMDDFDRFSLMTRFIKLMGDVCADALKNPCTKTCSPGAGLVAHRENEKAPLVSRTAVL